VCGDDIVAVGRYEALAGGEDVEGAFVVRDDVQGQGLGSALVARIACEARAHGKVRMVAEVLPGNLPMLRAFRRLGEAVTTRFADGVVEVVVPLGIVSC
jgi:GNAT superfamily N-acetyltransferase